MRPPDQFMRSAWAKRWRAAPIVPRGVAYTCAQGKGAVDDYLVCPEAFRPFILDLEPVLRVPWSPHIGMHLKIAADPSSVSVRVLCRAVGLQVPQ